MSLICPHGYGADNIYNICAICTADAQRRITLCLIFGHEEAKSNAVEYYPSQAVASVYEDEGKIDLLGCARCGCIFTYSSSQLMQRHFNRLDQNEQDGKNAR